MLTELPLPFKIRFPAYVHYRQPATPPTLVIGVVFTCGKAVHYILLKGYTAVSVRPTPLLLGKTAPPPILAHRGLVPVSV